MIPVRQARSSTGGRPRLPGLALWRGRRGSMISQSSSGTKGRAIAHLRSGALGPLHYTARLFLKQFLKDLDFAAGYITEAIEEGEAAFLLAVRDVVEAQGGIGELAKSTSLNCEGLYDMLSEKGNP